MSGVLPDSRIGGKDCTLGTVMADWTFDEVAVENGVAKIVKRSYRLEMQPIFCINCGKLDGYVPLGIMSWVSFLCDRCGETHGQAAALLDCPDASFWDKVREEMVKAYGHGLTQAELTRLVERGELTLALQLLEHESPFKGKT